MEDLAKCVHCGLCVNACPTYAITGLETESPRGRIYLARAVSEETIPVTQAVEGRDLLIGVVNGGEAQEKIGGCHNFIGQPRQGRRSFW